MKIREKSKVKIVFYKKFPELSENIGQINIIIGHF
jgi:hypothetical protein